MKEQNEYLLIIWITFFIAVGLGWLSLVRPFAIINIAFGVVSLFLGFIISRFEGKYEKNIKAVTNKR